MARFSASDRHPWLVVPSYFGAGELVMLIAAAGSVGMPFALVTGHLTPMVAVEALLIGLWLVQVIVCSNSQDAIGDAASGRMTLAAQLSPHGNRVYIATVFSVTWALPLLAWRQGVLPGAQLLWLVPAWTLHASQLRYALMHGQWLRARQLGFWAFRIGIVGLLLANLLQA